MSMRLFSWIKKKYIKVTLQNTIAALIIMRNMYMFDKFVSDYKQTSNLQQFKYRHRF